MFTIQNILHININLQKCTVVFKLKRVFADTDARSAPPIVHIPLICILPLKPELKLGEKQ